MRTQPFELELPLSDAPASRLARQRIDHLRAIGGIEPAALVRLVRAFPTLGDLYAAGEDELGRLVGPVTAARIRWFLDAPLETRLAVEEPAAEPVLATGSPLLRSAA